MREFAGFAEDFGEAVGEPVEATARSAVWQRAAEHLEHMLSSEQRIDDSVEAGAKQRQTALSAAEQDAGVLSEPVGIPAARSVNATSRYRMVISG